jgi:anti-sigma factor RsiW
MNRHLTNDELLDRLYGIGDNTGAAHLAACPECSTRYLEFENRRAASNAEPPISNASLAAQRRAIYAHIDSEANAQTRWAPALAAGVLLAVGVFLYRPLTHIADRPRPAAHTEISDEQLFSEVYSMEESAEPRAAAPIQGLFESTGSDPSEEVQY